MAKNAAEKGFVGEMLGDVLPVAAAIATKVRSVAPPLGKVLLLANWHPNAVPTYYRTTRTRMAEVEFGLIHYDPDELTLEPKGSKAWQALRRKAAMLPLPALYRGVATTKITNIGAELRRRFLQGLPYEQRPTAIVWGGLGNVAMAGVLTEEQSRSMFDLNRLRYHTLLSEASAGLDTALGFYDPEARTVYVPGGAVLKGSVTPLDKFNLDEPIF